MRGSIRSKGKNSWQLQAYSGKVVNGKYERYYETVHSPRIGDAQKRLRAILTSLDKGVPVPPSGQITLTVYLRKWLQSYASNKAPHTFESYTTIAEKHLIPSIGSYKLKALTGEVIQEYYANAYQKLSPRSVAKHHRLLSQVCKHAVRSGYLGINPCSLVDAPKWQPKPMITLTESEIALFLEAAHDSNFYPVYYTAVSTGLRQTELLGLRWRDIDFSSGSSSTLSCCRTLFKRNGVLKFTEPKTQHSRRRISLTDKLTAFLKDYQGQRELASFRLRGKSLGLDDLVFSNVKFEALDPSMLSHEFLEIARKLGLDGAHFHTLRHSFGSIMLMKGAPAKVVSECLGHSSVAFTLSVYAHVLPGMQEKAIQALNDALPVG